MPVSGILSRGGNRPYRARRRIAAFPDSRRRASAPCRVAAQPLEEISELQRAASYIQKASGVRTAKPFCRLSVPFNAYLNAKVTLDAGNHPHRR
jgi:hypothetical protein